MRALSYILRCSFKNTIKGLVRKPVTLIAYLLIACFFLGTFYLSAVNQSEASSRLSSEAAKAIFMGYTLFLFVTSFMASLRGTSFFRMADVNMLFTSPIKSGSILTYGFVKQLGANLMVMLFLALQYPNWKRMFGFIDGAGWILIAAYMLLVALTSVLGMILYAYVSINPHRAIVVRNTTYGFIFAMLLPIAVKTYRTGDILNSIVGWLSNDNLKFIPLVGWFREILLGTYSGVNANVAVHGFITLATIIVAFIYLYRMKTGFYEHVLVGTEHKEQMVRNMRQGQTRLTNPNRRYRKVKGEFTREGSWAIFQKQMLEKRKGGFWLVSVKTVLLLSGAVVAAISISVDSMVLMAGILAASAYLMFIFAMIGSWESELNSHYIYLIPADPLKKLLSATLPEVIKTLIEGCLVFGSVGLILKAPVGVVLSLTLAYVMLGAVLTYSDLVLRRMFGKIHGKVLRIFFRILLLLIVVLLVVIPSVVVLLRTGNYAAGYLTMALINSVLTLLFVFIGIGLFKSPEFD